LTATNSPSLLRTLLLAGWTATLGQGLIVPLLPVCAAQSGASGFLVGCIFGVFALARTLFMPAFGRLSDRRGRKPFITTGVFLYFIFALALISILPILFLVPEAELSMP
jgi:MFS family permease